MDNKAEKPQQQDALNGRTLLICVGAAKCATSWLHNYLDTLPEVAVSPLKEVHYFDALFPQYALGHVDDMAMKRLKYHMAQSGDVPQNLRQRDTFQASVDRAQMIYDPNAYFAHFARLCGPDTRLLTDITPAYAVIGREGFDFMKAFCASQDTRLKILFIMRDPVDRLWSQFRHMAQVLPDKMSLENWKAATENPRLMARANYRQTVTDLDAVFPAKDLLYLFYEDLMAEPTLRRLCSFASVAPGTPDVHEKLNETAVKRNIPDEVRAAYRDALAPQYDFCRARFADQIPEKWIT